MPHFVPRVLALAVGLTLLLAPAGRADDELSDEELDICISVAKDPTEAKRVEAVQKIVRYGPRAKKAVAVLLECLKSKGPLGTAAADALGAIGPEAKKDSAPALRELLVGYSDPNFQGAVVLALGKIDPTDRQTIKTLNDLLRSAMASNFNQPQVPARLLCQQIAAALEKAGPAAAPAVKDLYSLTSTRFHVTRYNGSYYSTTIYPETDQESRPVRLAAIKALEAIGTAEAKDRLGRLAIFAGDLEVKKAARKSLDALKSGPVAVRDTTGGDLVARKVRDALKAALIEKKKDR